MNSLTRKLVKYYIALNVFVIISGSQVIAATNSDDSISNEQTSVSEGRTYVHHFAKRFSMLLLPLMFLLGVMTTMMGVITAVSVKGLMVGVILMVVGVSHVLAKAYQANSAISVPFVQTLAAAPPIIRHSPPTAPYWARRSYNSVDNDQVYSPHYDSDNKIGSHLNNYRFSGIQHDPGVIQVEYTS